MSTTLTPLRAAQNDADPETDRWAALGRFARALSNQVLKMTRRGQRGFMKNVEILEAWVREALLKMAERIELPAPRRKPYHRPTLQELLAPTCKEAAQRTVTTRTPGFRAILPDEVERQLADQRRPQLVPGNLNFRNTAQADLRDRRIRYRQRLAAINAVLQNPERYARRVKRKLTERQKRSHVKVVAVRHGSALPDLLRLPRSSEEARLIWYDDSS